MSISAILYSITDQPDVLNKTLGPGHTITNIKPYDGCSLLNPQLILDYDESVVNYNYMYIPKFKRYYFLQNPIVITAGRMVISGTVDPLMSWREGLSSCLINVIRSNKKPTYVPDDKLPIDTSRYFTTGYSFPYDPISYDNLDGAKVRKYLIIVNNEG